MIIGAIASTANGATAPTNIITDSQSVVNLFCAALAWLFWGLIIVGIAMFFVGGYIYATSNGEPEKVGKATKTLTYAAIAIVVALVARGVPILIGAFFSVPSSQLNACS